MALRNSADVRDLEERRRVCEGVCVRVCVLVRVCEGVCVRECAWRRDGARQRWEEASPSDRALTTCSPGAVEVVPSF